MFGAGPFAGAPFGAPLSAGSGGAAFSISPSVGHATGTIAITATGFGTSWTGSNPFSVTGGSGSATISNYANVSGTSATFDLNLTVLGTIQITDSDSASAQTYNGSAVVPSAPTSVVLVDNHDGTVTASYTQSSDNGGATITGNSLLTSSGQTASAASAGAPITFSPVNGVSITVQVRSTNSVGNSSYSTASSAIIPNNYNVVTVLVRAPYLTTDTLGTKTVQLYAIQSDILTAIGSAITTGFIAIPNVTNGWWIALSAVPNGAFGDFAGIAVFGNINGSNAAAVEVYSPPTLPPSSLVVCKVAPYLTTDTITTPGYQLYDAAGSAVGSHVTGGIVAIPGVTNGYCANIALTPDANSGAQLGILWDGG